MFREEISKNKTKSFFLVFFFLLFVIAVSYIIGMALGYAELALPIALTIALLSTAGSYYYSDKIVLTMSNARPATHEEDAQLDNILDGLCLAAGLPKPKAYVIEDTAPNAFATGRNPKNAVVCVTTGLMQKLNRAELEGVIAHELSHIKHYDILLMTLTVVMVGIVALLSDWMMRSFWWGGSRRNSRRSRDAGGATAIFVILGLILAILAPVIAQLIRLAISRRREFLADAGAVSLTRYPEGLINALKKITADTEPLEAANKATAHLYIVNPLLEHRNKLNDMFSTHPPIGERIAALERM